MKRQQLIGVLSVALVLGSAFIVGLADGQTMESEGTAKAFITSRFILWDTNEKMIDTDFYIDMIYFNSSDNHSANFEIILAENYYYGTFIYNRTMNFTLTDGTVFNLEVNINNETVLSGQHIIVVSGVNEGGIRIGHDPFTINLLPSQWRELEWNIFFSSITAFIIGVPISYRLVKRYRRVKGVREVK